MADISRYIEKINKAKYGEEVRSSISDALTAMNEEAENAKEWATGEGTDVPGGGSVPGTENNAEYYAQQAAASAATLVVDPTLTVEGRAADAKETGIRTYATYTAEGNSIEFDSGGAESVDAYTVTISAPIREGTGNATPSNRRDINNLAQIVLTENGTDTSISFDPSIVVGSWNVLTGEYVTDYAFKSYDGTENVSLRQRGNSVAAFTITTPNVATKMVRTIVSNYFETLSTSHVNVIQQGYSISGLSGGTRGFAVSFKDDFFGGADAYAAMSDADLVAAVKAWILACYNSNHPLQIAYQTASSTQTGSTTPHSPTLDDGNNTIETSAGTIGVAWRIPLKDYIDRKIDALEAGEKKTVTTTVLGNNLPANAEEKFDISGDYISLIKNAIDTWMAAYAGDAQIIPFVVHTDQHGALTSANKKYFDLLDYIVNWDGISAIFNLGDTVNNLWTDDPTNENPLLRNGELENALVCTASIPLQKQVNIFGNHDTWYSSVGSVPTPVSGTLPSLQYLNPYFKQDGLRTVRKPDNSGLMVVYDDKFMVKYVVLANWDYADKPSDRAYIQTWINQEHLEWMIAELARNDGYDVVIVAHYPLELKNGVAIDPTTSTLYDGTTWRIIHSTDALNPLWIARKNKTAGSVSYGNVSASYDFTNCDKPLLCALSGHTHQDLIEHMGSNEELLQIAFDRFTNTTKALHLGLIDRRSNKVKVWKINASSMDAQNWEAEM